jgi:hypothetical protein
MQYKWILICSLLIAVTIASTILLGYSILSENETDKQQAQQIIWGQSAYQNASRDPYVINSYEINDDILKVEVSFGGGCRAHDFAFIALPGFMESSPVAANVLLSHDANNDLCEAWLTEDLRFDLSSLKQEWQETYDQKSGAVRILLNHGEELPDVEILYEF